VATKITRPYRGHERACALIEGKTVKNQKSVPERNYTSLLKISSGGLFKIPLLLNNPITMVNIAIAKNSNNAGNRSALNGISKLNFASSQLPTKAIKIPVAADKAPKKKYSIAVIANICLRLAPMVRSSTLSCIR
jgi:hypothetical protein